MMDSERKIEVVSKIDGIVGLNLPELHFSRTWKKKNSTALIPMGVLVEGIYDEGFRYMLEQGILYIDSKEIRVELGLEAPDENKIFALTDNQKLRMLKVDTADKFKEELDEIPKEQVIELANFAIEKEIVDTQKAKILKAKCGIDIFKAIQLEEANKED